MMIEEKMAIEKEERRSRRKLVMENIQYTFMPPENQKTFDAAITNISESGVCLVTASLLKDGQKIIIKNNAQLSGKTATVRWSQHYEEQFYKVGLEFDKPYSVPDTQDAGEQKKPIRTHNSTEGKSSFIEAQTEHTQDIKKDDLAAQASETPDTSQPSQQIGGELCKQVPAEAPQEESGEPAYITSTRDNPSRSKQGRDRDRKIRVLPVFLIILLVIGIVTGGVFLYRSFIQDRTIQPAKDLICSIQVGAFKSEANAQVLLQKYKDKGHRVFIDKSDIKDKGIMYKVLIGPFQQISDTSQIAEDIRLKENINPFVMCQ